MGVAGVEVLVGACVDVLVGVFGGVWVEVSVLVGVRVVGAGPASQALAHSPGLLPNLTHLSVQVSGGVGVGKHAEKQSFG